MSQSRTLLRGRIARALSYAVPSALVAATPIMTAGTWAHLMICSEEGFGPFPGDELIHPWSLPVWLVVFAAGSISVAFIVFVGLAHLCRDVRPGIRGVVLCAGLVLSWPLLLTLFVSTTVGSTPTENGIQDALGGSQHAPTAGWGAGPDRVSANDVMC